jgi:hypothetical protein
MDLTLSSHLFNKVLFEQEVEAAEQQQEEVPPTEIKSVEDLIRDIINPDSKEEAEKINKVKVAIQQTGGEIEGDVEVGIEPAEGEEEIPLDELPPEELTGLNIDYSKINQLILQHKLHELHTDIKQYSHLYPADEEIKNILFLCKIILDLYHSFTYEDIYDKIRKITQHFLSIKKKKIK